MKNIYGLLVIATLLGSVINLNAQDQTEGKIKVEISRDVNGEKQTFKGEYNSREEMRADPNYQEFTGKDKEFDFWFDQDFDEENLMDHFDHLKRMGNAFKFFDEDEGANFFFKHFDGDTANSFRHFKFDGPHMEEFEERMKELGIEFETLMDQMGEDGDNHFKVITLKRVKVSDVSGEEFGRKGAVSKSNKLVLEDLSFSPNPSSNGRVRVRFKVPSEDELNIRVYNLDGKEIFNRYFERFGGMYSETIDLSGQKEGIYLLEITQGGKRLTKKIAIN